MKVVPLGGWKRDSTVIEHFHSYHCCFSFVIGAQRRWVGAVRSKEGPRLLLLPWLNQMQVGWRGQSSVGGTDGAQCLHGLPTALPLSLLQIQLSG